MNLEDKKQLDRYIDIVNKLVSSNFLKKGSNVSFNLRYNNENGIVKQSMPNFDEEQFKAFIMDFRKLYSDKSESSCRRICNLILQNCTDDDVRKNIQGCQKLLKEYDKKSPIKYILNGNEETPEKMIKKWFNGQYFHEDLEKSVEIKKLGIGKGMNKFVMVSSIIDYTMVYIVVMNNIKKL